MPIQAPAIHLFIQGNQLVVASGKNQKRFDTLPYLIAKIMNVLACILPCFFLGAAEIRVENNIYYISRSDIKNQLQVECDWYSARSLDNVDVLKILVQNYYASEPHARIERK